MRWLSGIILVIVLSGCDLSQINREGIEGFSCESTLKMSCSIDSKDRVICGMIASDLMCEEE